MADIPAPPRGILWKSFHLLWQGMIILFVVCHLVIIAVNNAKDLIAEPEDDDEATPSVVHRRQFYDTWRTIDPHRYSNRYMHITGTDQGWVMFGSPLAREGTFPAVRLDFTDGSSELIKCLNEQETLHSYWRVGNLRQRKLDEYVSSSSVKTKAQGNECHLFRNYVMRRYADWHATHADDQRELVSLTLVSRCYQFINQTGAEKPMEYAEVISSDLVSYTPDGELQP